MGVLLEFSMFPTSGNCREGSSFSKQVAKIKDRLKNKIKSVEKVLNREINH